jgi:hypothetical protein
MSKTTRKNAAGVQGCIIGDIFRVYDGKGDFTDYEILVDDLGVTIDVEEMVEFVETADGRHILDYSAQVLGLNKE